MTRRIALITGSLRRASLSRRVAHALPRLAPAGFEFHDVAIGDLPLYDEDLEAEPPAAWRRFRAAIRESDAVLFVVPEYNRGMPGAVKNAVDVGSRPYGKNAWNGKPACIMGLSSGPLGGMAAVHNLRQALVTVNVASMAHPEVYLREAAKLFGDDGHLVPATQEFLAGVLARFEEWVARFAPSASA